MSVSKATFAVTKYSYLGDVDTDADNGHNYIGSNAMVPIFHNVFSLTLAGPLLLPLFLPCE